jgi:WD40 repeat protein
LLATGSRDGVVLLWDADAEVTTGGCQRLPSNLSYVTALPGARAFAAVSTNRAASVFDLVTLRATLVQDPQQPQGTNIVREAIAARIAARGKLPAYEHKANVAKIGNALVSFDRNSSDEEVVVRNLSAPGQAPAHFVQRGTMWRVALSPDGRTFAVSSQSGIVVLYDAEKQERIATLHGHLKSARGVEFTPDGGRLASTSGGNEAVKLWDVKTGRELLTLSGYGDLLDLVEFTDDGNTLLVGSPVQAGLWQYWSAPSWEEIAEAEKTHGTWPETRDATVAKPGKHP